MLDWQYCYRMFYVAVTFKIICIDNQNKLCYLTSTQIKIFIKIKIEPEPADRHFAQASIKKSDAGTVSVLSKQQVFSFESYHCM